MADYQSRAFVPMRLRDVVAKGRKAKLFTVFGPTGSGRSTLLDLYTQPLVANSACHVVEIEASRIEAGIDTLWQALACGLDDGPSYLLSEAERALDEGANAGAIELFCERLFEVVDERGVQYCCVIDDVHLIPGGAALSLLQTLADRAPSSFRFAFAGLKNPGIAVSRLRLSGNIVEVRAADLTLMQAEVGTVIRFLAPQATREQAQRVWALTEGWPLGVRMLGMQLAVAEDPARLLDQAERGSGWLADFVHEELLVRLEAEALRLAVNLSVLDVFNTRQAAYAVPKAPVGPCLRELLLKGIVVPAGAVESGAAETWYRCHPMVHPVLKRDAELEVAHEARKELLQRAAAWLNANGYYRQAVQTALSVRDYRMAFGIVEENMFSIMTDTDRASILECLEEIERPAEEDACLHALISAWMAFGSGRPRRASRWLRYAEKMRPYSRELDRRAQRSIGAVMGTLSVGIMVFEGEYDQAIADGLALAEELGGPQLFLRATVLHNVGEALERLGRYHDAWECLARAKTDAVVCGYRTVEMLCECEMAWLLFVDGRLDAASGVAMRALSDCNEHEKDNLWPMGLLHTTLARQYLQWDEPGKARLCIERAEPYITVERNRDAYLECRVTLARCYAREGDFEAAYELLLDCYELHLLDQVPRGVGLLVLVTFAETLYGRGQNMRAARVLDEVEALVDERDYFYRVHACIVRSLLERAEGQLGNAESLLRDGLDLATAHGVRSLATDCKIKLSDVCYAVGGEEEAFRLFLEGLGECVEEGRIYPFRHMSAAQKSMLYAIAHGGNNNLVVEAERAKVARFARELLERFGGGGLSGPSAENVQTGSSGVELLSEREREIYELLKQGKTRKEISEVLDIRVNTVRTHVRNVYKKLGVHDRSML